MKKPAKRPLSSSKKQRRKLRVRVLSTTDLASAVGAGEEPEVEGPGPPIFPTDP